jgi:hypothetical protein
VLLALLAGGCTHERKGPVGQHYLDFATRPPRNNTVYVCHAYGCRKQTPFRFTDEDIAALKTLMAKTRKADTPAEERRAIAYAIGWMERRTGDVIGTKADRPGMDFSASGDPTQQDCVDEATNTTSYLIILQSHGLLKYHTVGIPMTKGDLLKATLQGDPVKYWPHWTAVIQETKTGQRFAVDSWIYVQGENPAVVEVEKWYIKDINNLPAATN